jgi:hypothetical protein
MNRVIPITSIERDCSGCTACCDGWLSGVAHGISFFPGRRCHFVHESGCSIYQDRPVDPCKTYQCQWLLDNNMPHWMKPSISKVVLTERVTNSGLAYVDMTECGTKVDSSILSWVIQYYLNRGVNLVYAVNGGRNFMGSPEFVGEMSS